jgi:hypothetical protein
MKIKLIVAVLVGIVFGILSSRYLLVGSALSLIPWGIVGLLLGIWCLTYKNAIVTGALYGFVVAFTFMVAGYGGSDPLLSKSPFFIILGVVGAVCGIGLSVIGSFGRKKYRQFSLDWSRPKER